MRNEVENVWPCDGSDPEGDPVLVFGGRLILKNVFFSYVFFVYVERDDC